MSTRKIQAVRLEIRGDYIKGKYHEQVCIIPSNVFNDLIELLHNHQDRYLYSLNEIEEFNKEASIVKKHGTETSS